MEHGEENRNHTLTSVFPLYPVEPEVQFISTVPICYCHYPPLPPSFITSSSAQCRYVGEGLIFFFLFFNVSVVKEGIRPSNH